MSGGDPHPEMAAILEAQRNAPSPPPETLPLAEARSLFVRNNEFWNQNAPPVRAADTVLGGIACRVLGSDPARVVLFIHGGG